MWISMCDQVCYFTFLLLLYSMGAFCGKCHCCYSFILLSVQWRGLGFTLVNLVRVSIGLHDLLCWDSVFWTAIPFKSKLGMIVQYQNHGQGRSEGSPPPKILHLLYVYLNWRTVCNLVCWHINMSWSIRRNVWTSVYGQDHTQDSSLQKITVSSLSLLLNHLQLVWSSSLYELMFENSVLSSTDEDNSEHLHLFLWACPYCVFKCLSLCCQTLCGDVASFEDVQL